MASPSECPDESTSACSASSRATRDAAARTTRRLRRSASMDDHGFFPCQMTQCVPCGTALCNARRHEGSPACRRCNQPWQCRCPRRRAPLGPRVGGRRTQQSHALQVCELEDDIAAGALQCTPRRVKRGRPPRMARGRQRTGSPDRATRIAKGPAPCNRRANRRAARARAMRELSPPASTTARPRRRCT